jgi:hypothetical protein
MLPQIEIRKYWIGIHNKIGAGAGKILDLIPPSTFPLPPS